MAGTERAPANAASMEDPSTSDPLSDGSGSQGKVKGKRLSSTSKFLQNIFCRLIPPFSPNSKSSPASSLSTSELPQTQLRQQPQLSTLALEDPEMAAIPVRPSISRSRESAGPLAPLSRTPSTASEYSKSSRPTAPVDSVPAASLGRLSLEAATARSPSPASTPRDICMPPSEKPIHQVFMDQALDMARLALRTNETPVGCVLVHNGAVIARGMNATNVTRNGTRHAEFMALSALLSYQPDNSEEAVGAQLRQQANERSKADARDDESDLFPMDDEYVRKGHVYPYGQKLHHAPRVDRSIVRECILYVTVEPCVMCAGLLRQLGIKKVFFGAVNDKFGGTGGVFSIHKNSTNTHRQTNTAFVPRPLQASANACNLSRPTSSSSGKSLLNSNRQQKTSQGGDGGDGGDGGNVELGFEAEGGWGRDEAVSLLRRFYVQENGRAPVPRKKEGRAARLAAMEQVGSDPATPVAVSSSDADAADDIAASIFNDSDISKA